MLEAEGKFLRIYDKLPFRAFVKIRLEETENPYIKIACNGDGWIGQGYYEYVSKSGYEDWKEGAIIGAKFALKKSQKSFGVTIFEIVGMTSDTSPASVGAAIIYAIWEVIKFVPSQKEIEYIENVVFTSSYENLPNFEKQ